MKKFFINTGFFQGKTVYTESSLEDIKNEPSKVTIWLGRLGVSAEIFRGEVISSINKPAKTFINYGSFKF